MQKSGMGTMIGKAFILLAGAASVSACVTMPQRATSGVQSAGPNLFTVSELNGFGNVFERAGAFCGSFGQQMKLEGNSTQKGLVSGSDYATIVFSCFTPEKSE